MKKVSRISILASLIAVALFSLSACSQSGESSNQSDSEGQSESSASEGSNTSEENNTEVVTISLSTSGTTAPFSYTDDDNNVIGYDIDVARAVFDKLPQYELEIVTVDLHSTLAEIDAGRCQISANNWNKTQERLEKYLFSDPILDCRYSAIFASDAEAVDVASLSDLGGKSTIVTAGSNVSVVLEDYNESHPDNPIIINYSDEDFAKMAQDVQDKLYDFILYPKVMFDIYEQNYGFDLKSVDVGTDLTDSLFNGNPYAYFVIGIDDEQLLEDVNAALAELQADGTIKEISETYFGDDYSASEWYTNAN